MQTPTLDKKTSTWGPFGTDWAAQGQITPNHKISKQKVSLVEERDEMLPHGLHPTEAQLQTESLTGNVQTILALAVFMRNALVAVNNHTPCQALLGRRPALLAPSEGIAAADLIEAPAIAKLERANKRKTIAAAERNELTTGDLLDIWYELAIADATGWRGQAQIANQRRRGNIDVRFQRRTLDRRH